MVTRLEEEGRSVMDLPGTISTIEDNLKDQAQQLKKRKIGRQHKILADLLLLQGFVNNAMAAVDTSIAATNQNKDYIWLAAALETKAAIVLMRQFFDKQCQPDDDTPLPHFPTTSHFHSKVCQSIFCPPPDTPSSFRQTSRSTLQSSTQALMSLTFTDDLLRQAIECLKKVPGTSHLELELLFKLCTHLGN